MPPSPALRCSPGREHRMESTHKRGRSLESGLPLKARDDDLALFNDMQNRERDSFLLHTSDDFDESLSKLRYFSDFKLGVTIPVRGESSNLLNADGEKNDYDWLLTPPDTPLFPSMDDDEPQPVNLLPRGRPRSQPISISRSSMTEKTHRTSRSSASPHRLSPSPRSTNSVVQSRGRPSSAPHSSPAPVLRPTTPSRRPSTPPNKPTTPTQRSSTPTLRGMSSGSSGQTSSSGRRGASPIKASRGNSASPKLRGWQSNLLGFSSDAPPNLRTSLSDRPSSHTRGSSPASRNGRDSSLKSGRQSMSPTASRSASSSHSHERDRFSSHSKGSVASSGDDDVDSLHSVTVGISGSTTASKNGVVVNSRAMSFSKKPSRTPSPSSVPKRSFDSALRQMDHRKTPQNMFRPLLSSVPAATFYVGKANSIHRPMFSRNSSITTSSNASSEHGASIAPDMECCDLDRNDPVDEWEKVQDPDTQEEVFIFDKVDETNEDTGREICDEKPQKGYGDFGSVTNKAEPDKFEKSSDNLGDAASVAAASISSYAACDHSEVDCCGIMATCSICGKSFCFSEPDGNTDVCQECAIEDVHFATGEPGTTVPVTQNEALQSEMTPGVDNSCSDLQLEMGEPVLPEKCSSQVICCQNERNIEQGSHCLPDSGPQSVMDERERRLADQQLESQQELNVTESDSRSKFQQSLHIAHPSLRIDSPEGTGISVLLLQRSSSSKWPVVQGRTFSATNILCAEPSYARENMNAMKRSIGRDSASASSSVDLGSSRQMEARVQRQLSSQRGEMDNFRSDLNAKGQSTGLSLSEVSVNDHEALCSKSVSEENFDVSLGGVECEALGETMLVTEEHDVSSGNTVVNATQCLSVRKAVLNGDVSIHADSYKAMDASSSELSGHLQSIHLRGASTADCLNDEDCASSGNADLFPNSERSIPNMEIPLQVDIPDSPVNEEEDIRNGGHPSSNDIYDSSMQRVLLGLENHHGSFQDSQTECTTFQNTSNMEAFHERSVSTTIEKDLLVALESNTVDHAHRVHEESTVKLEGPGRHMTRSLTLDEATDTILFCSSIIHDLAYKAATIGMQNEDFVPPEASPPTVTILGKPVSERNDSQMVSSKRTPKSQKAKRKRLEPDSRPPAPESGDIVKIQESTPCNPEILNKVDSTKPPKLESKCHCTVM